VMKFVTRLSSLTAALAATIAVLCVGNRPTAASPPAAVVATGVTGQDGAGYGTIKGRLVWGGDKAPEQKVKFPKGKADKDPAVCAKNAPIMVDDLVVDPKTKGVQNAFVYLVKPTGQNAGAVKAIMEAHPKAEIDQKNCTFQPHILPVYVDQPVIFKSSDPTNHNVRLAAITNESFNQMLPANGQMERKLVFEARPLAVTCDIHPWMKGYLMVFNHPFYAVTGEDGSFEIKGVPAGTQNLNLWQEKVGYVTGTIAAHPFRSRPERPSMSVR